MDRNQSKHAAAGLKCEIAVTAARSQKAPESHQEGLPEAPIPRNGGLSASLPAAHRCQQHSILSSSTAFCQAALHSSKQRSILSNSTAFFQAA
eukprot:636237-Pelagomonas_calceolata.AAC.1